MGLCHYGLDNAQDFRTFTWYSAMDSCGLWGSITDQKTGLGVRQPPTSCSCTLHSQVGKSLFSNILLIAKQRDRKRGCCRTILPDVKTVVPRAPVVFANCGLSVRSCYPLARIPWLDTSVTPKVIESRSFLYRDVLSVTGGVCVSMVLS